MNVNPLELWRPVKDYEGKYEISADGRVRSLGGRRGSRVRLLKQYAVKDYLRVSLCVGKKREMLVHRLVAEAFVPNPSGLPHVNHLDGIKSHNDRRNLEWTSHHNNMKHAIKAGLIDNRGERHGMHKLNPEEVRYIRAQLLRGWPKAQRLATKFGVSPSAVYDIWNLRTWKHIQP